MIRFFNTLSGRVEPFVPITPGEVKLYTCGPTVYDYAHIGNFRAYIFEDLLKRFLTFMGHKVLHIMNITDVDDKTIRNSRDKGLSLQAYTRKYIEAFFEDIRLLNIAPANIFPRATEHVPGMVEMIKGLLQKGYAYEKDGSYYFNISKFPDYGRLSKIDRSALKTGVQVEADEYEKENLQDFALWKARKEDEPYWETELGPGRPGWHIECSAMSYQYLGGSFDIHCGGVDNIFPHHENEIAQSEAYFGAKFVNYWLHCHHLIVDGEKMSKSKGNQYTLADLRRRNTDVLALRLLLLSTHYRKTLNFTFEALEQSHAALKRMKDFLYELETRSFLEGENEAVAKIIEETRARFVEGLSDDLNISVALTAVFSLIKDVNILITGNEIRRRDAGNLLLFIRAVDNVLGVLPQKKDEALPPEVMEKIAAREKARREKNFGLADALRKELLALGIILEDTKDGVRWKITGKKP